MKIKFFSLVLLSCFLNVNSEIDYSKFDQKQLSLEEIDCLTRSVISEFRYVPEKIKEIILQLPIAIESDKYNDAFKALYTDLTNNIEIIPHKNLVNAIENIIDVLHNAKSETLSNNAELMQMLSTYLNDLEADKVPTIVNSKDVVTRQSPPKCGKIYYFDRIVVKDFIKVMGTLDANKICLSGCAAPLGCSNTGGRAACTIGGGCPTGMTCIGGECFPIGLIGTTGATGATGSAGSKGATGVTGATGVLSDGSLVFTVTDMHKLATASAAPELSLSVTYSTPTAPILAWKMSAPVLGVDLTPISLVFQVPADYDSSVGSMTVTLNIVLDNLGSVIGDMANVRVSAAFETNNTVITTASAYADQVTTGAFAVNPPGLPGIRYLQKTLIVDTSTAAPGDWAVFVFDRVSAGGLFTDAAYIGLSNVNITYPRI